MTLLKKPLPFLIYTALHLFCVLLYAHEEFLWKVISDVYEYYLMLSVNSFSLFLLVTIFSSIGFVWGLEVCFKHCYTWIWLTREAQIELLRKFISRAIIFFITLYFFILSDACLTYAIETFEKAEDILKGYNCLYTRQYMNLWIQNESINSYFRPLISDTYTTFSQICPVRDVSIWEGLINNLLAEKKWRLFKYDAWLYYLYTDHFARYFVSVAAIEALVVHIALLNNIDLRWWLYVDRIGPMLWRDILNPNGVIHTFFFLLRIFTLNYLVM